MSVGLPQPSAEIDGPIVSCSWDQATDGSFVALVRVSGLNSMAHAKGDLHRMREALTRTAQQAPAAAEPVAWGYHNGKEWLTTTDFEMVKAMIQASGLKVYPLHPGATPVTLTPSPTAAADAATGHL